MQIKADPPQKRYWNFIKQKIYQTFFQHISKRQNSIWFVIIVSAGIVLYSFGLYTAGVVSQRNYGVSNLLFKPIILDNYKIIKRQLFSYFENPVILRIDIKHKNFQKLEYNRQLGIAKGTMYGVENEWINVNIYSENNKIFPAKIRLKGATAEEHLVDSKWSFRIKIKGKNRFLQMKEFAVMDPMRRNLLGEWFIRKVFQKEGIITRKYEFIEVIMNGKSKGIYVIDERYDNVMLERNHRKEGPVMKLDQTPMFAEKPGFHPEERDDYYFQMDYISFNQKKFLNDKNLKKQFFHAKNLMESFRLGLLKTNQVFDIEKLSKWVAISDVMGAWHGFGFANMRFYFNSVIGKFEPVPDDNYNERAYNFAHPIRLFRLNDSYNEGKFLKFLFSDYIFTERYLKELERVTKVKYLDGLFEEFDDEIMLRSYVLAKDYPLYNFLLDSKNYTYQNAQSLRNILSPYKGVQSYIKDKREEGLLLQLANNKTVPMEILYLTNNQNNVFQIQSSEKIILEGRDYASPVSYQNIFFKYIGADNLTYEQQSNLSIVYRILGTSVNRQAPVFPFPAFEREIVEYKNYNEINEFSKRFSFLNYDTSKKEITFKKGSWKIDQDLIVPEGYTMVAYAGTEIDLINSAMIYSNSPLAFLGTENNPIKIFSSDSTGQGITVIKAERSSLFKYVTFQNLSRPNRGNWELEGAINFYESPVSMYETHFEHNIVGDDYINIIRSDFSINRTSVTHSVADALDVDFGKGKIKDSQFSFCGFQDGNGDCLDFSGSKVEIDNVLVNNAGDKAFSIGEQSELSINKSGVHIANIAIAVKDLSVAKLKGTTISHSKYGLTAFQKKPEFGSGTIFADNLKMIKVSFPYLKEKESFISVDSEEIKSEYSNVRSILYSSFK